MCRRRQARSAPRRAVCFSRSAATSSRRLRGAPQHHYLVRSVDPVEPPLAVPHASYVTGRGPFGEADDHALLEAHRIEVVVAKNSGGTATYGKIAAARALGMPVIMLRRPALPQVPAVATVDEAVAWLDHALTTATRRVDQRRTAGPLQSRVSPPSRR